MEWLLKGMWFILCSWICAMNFECNGVESPFPDDLLTPYTEHRRSKRSLRFVRECQPAYFGNLTHEEFLSSNMSGSHSVKVHNIFYEYGTGVTKQQVHGHCSIAEDPLRTFSILEPGNIGGCKKSFRATVAETSGQRSCIVASNAGYFRTKNGHCLGNIFSDGKMVLDAGGIQNANFGIRKDGTIVTGYLSEEMVTDNENPFVQLVSGVVWLIRRGSVYVNVSKKIECEDLEETGSVDVFVNVVSGRTAIGHDALGRIVLVQIDGRTHHRGMNLYDFANYLKKLGLVNAINLDGGGSATFVVNGTTVNYPSDQCGQFICPRKVSTIACFHEPDCNPRFCNNHGTCEMGVCVCHPQWTGDQCDVLECSHSKCSLNGICTEDGCVCSPGWTGSTCDKECPPGKFGANCSAHCNHCQNSGICNSVDGACLCQPGWIGTLCEQQCFPGRYGNGCAQICNCSKSCACDATTGLCNEELKKNTYPDYWNNLTKHWIQCVTSKPNMLPSNAPELSGHQEGMQKEYRTLLFWFVGVTSLCAVSMLANFVLFYLQCNSVKKRKMSRARRLEEQEFLFISDEEL